MDSLFSTIKNAAAGTTTTDDKNKNQANPDQPSASELMASAKVVAEAAQFASNKQSDKIDKAKVAGAAADIVDAAEKYGKFDETKGVGQYLQKAEDYLHKYEKSGGADAPPAPAKEAEAPPAAAEEEKKKVEKEESGSGFGAADAFKAAGSFFK